VRVDGFVLGAVTVAALDLILLVGAAGEPPPWFGALVLAMDLSLAASSVALGASFLRRHRPLLGVLFLGNLAVMLAALALRASGADIPRAVLFGADLYWLNLYLVGLVTGTREGRAPWPGPPPQPTGPAPRESAQAASSDRPGD
jgi:hypothetical protein